MGLHGRMISVTVDGAISRTVVNILNRMAGLPPHQPYGPPFYPPLHGHPPPPPHGHHPPPPPHGHHPPPPYYVPGAVMMPYPVYPPAYPAQPEQPTLPPTYVTNHYYNTTPEGVSVVSSAPPIEDISPELRIVEENRQLGIEWIPATNTTSRYLEGRAVVGGYEGWDGSPLWVIRATQEGDLIPGKLSVRHNSAYVAYNGKEISVQNIEVLVAPPSRVKWIPCGNGSVPAGAIPGGNTATGETLYIGRARYQLSLTPGKVHPSHQTCYISFGGNEVSHKMYDVLCRV